LQELLALLPEAILVSCTGTKLGLTLPPHGLLLALPCACVTLLGNAPLLLRLLLP